MQAEKPAVIWEILDERDPECYLPRLSGDTQGFWDGWIYLPFHGAYMKVWQSLLSGELPLPR